MDREDARIIAEIARYRARLASLRPQIKPLPHGNPRGAKAQPVSDDQSGLRRRVAAAILNILHEGPETTSASEVTPFGLNNFLVELQKRAGIPSITKKTAARRLLNYLTEPAKSAPADGRVNPEHLARLVVFLRRVSRFGWDHARPDIAMLGGTEVTDALARFRAKRSQRVKDQRRRQTVIIDG